MHTRTTHAHEYVHVHEILHEEKTYGGILIQCSYVYACTCKYVYMYMYLCVHVCTYTHTFHLHASPEWYVIILLRLYIFHCHVPARPRMIQPLSLGGKGRLAAVVSLRRV